MGKKSKAKKEKNYAVEYLRPDGWWEAGRGWTDPELAERAAAAQLPETARWRVVVAPKKPRKGVPGDAT